jgi:hypothetical protein
MTLTTCNVTGNLVLPDGSAQLNAIAVFALSSVEIDGEVVIPREVRSSLGAAGALDVDLWPNARGTGTTHYALTVDLYADTNASRKVASIPQGLVAVPDTAGADIADILSPPGEAAVLPSILAGLIHAATAKATPVGADEIPLADSAASFGLKKATITALQGSVFQTRNANLTAISAVTPAADTLAYFTGPGAAAVTSITSLARTLLDDTTASAMRVTLGLGSLATLSIVDSANLANEAVVSSKIAPGAIGATRLADGSVIYTKIGSGAVIESKIGTGAVTSTKIATEAVTIPKLGSDVIDFVTSGSRVVGAWDASSGAFPSGSSQGDAWVVSVAGTVDGVAFAAGDRIVATVVSASTTTYAGNWVLVPVAAPGVFATRTELAAETVVEGAVYWASGYPYRGKIGSTAISDLPDLIPAGIVYVNHFGDVDPTGTANDTATFQAAADSGYSPIHVPPGIYKFSSRVTVTLDDTYFVGAGAFHVSDLSIVEDGYADAVANAQTVIQFDSGATAAEMFRWEPADTSGDGRVVLGGGMKGILLDGNDTATFGLHTISVRGGQFDVPVIRCATYCIALGVNANGVADSSGTAQAGNSSQGMGLYRLSACNKGVVGNTGGALLLYGTGTDYNGNFSLATIHGSTFFVNSGVTAIDAEDSDAWSIDSSRWNSKLILHATDTGVSGLSTSDARARQCRVNDCQGQIEAKAATGTPSTNSSFGNMVIGYSRGNSVPLPVIGNGADLAVIAGSSGTSAASGSLIYGFMTSGAALKRTGGLSIPDATDTDLTWQGTVYDPLSAIASSAMSVPNGIKSAKIWCSAKFAASTTGKRRIKLYLAGTLIAQKTADASLGDDAVRCETTGYIMVAPGNAITVKVYQESGGGALNVVADNYQTILAADFE